MTVFFKRAANRIRDRYGSTAYIDATGPGIRIADSRGTLGEGQTLKDAIASADAKYRQRFPLCANCNLIPVSDPDDRFCDGCQPFVRAVNQ